MQKLWMKLQEPFLDKDLDWRVQQSGLAGNNPWALVLCYVDARAIMNRLDEVVGPENWMDSYEHIDGGVKCKISICYEGNWITKEDGSPETKVEAFKGGFSKAFVRCAVKWGIGRYLYDLPTTFAKFVTPEYAKKNKANVKKDKINGKFYYWEPPRLNK